MNSKLYAFTAGLTVGGLYYFKTSYNVNKALKGIDRDIELDDVDILNQEKNIIKTKKQKKNENNQNVNNEKEQGGYLKNLKADMKSKLIDRWNNNVKKVNVKSNDLLNEIPSFPQQQSSSSSKDNSNTTTIVFDDDDKKTSSTTSNNSM